jgi:hypothetical protein
MENEHVISGLIRKRAEIAGALDAAQTLVRQLIIDLDNVDATLRLFDPDIGLAEIKPKPLPPRHAAYKGDLARGLLDEMRQAGRPLPASELTLRFMATKGLNTADRKLVITMQKRIGASLRNMRLRRLVVSEQGGQRILDWSLPR